MCIYTHSHRIICTRVGRASWVMHCGRARTHFERGFWHFPYFVKTDARILGIAEIRPRPLLYISFYIYCSLILLPSAVQLSNWLINSMKSRVIVEKLAVAQLVKEFPAFYGTRRFISLFRTASHLSLSWARSIQSAPSRPVSVKTYINILLLTKLYGCSRYVPSWRAVGSDCTFHL
jgi:hypothetical protein